MGVYVRPDSSYYWLRLDGYRDEKGHQLREATRIRIDAPTGEQRLRNEKLAKRAFHDRMSELARQGLEPEQKPAITLDLYLDEWWLKHELPKRKGKDRDQIAVTHLRDGFGHLPLSEITPDRVKAWRTTRLSTPTAVTQTKRRTTTRYVQAGPNTVNREEAVLKSILQSAVPKYLTTSPLYGMKRLRVTKTKRRILSEAEEARLIAALHPHDQPIVIMGIDTLCRLSDILDLRRDDDHGTYLYISEPKDPEQSVPYTVPVSKRLRKALDALPMAGPFYFAHRRKGKKGLPSWRSGIRTMIRSACRRAKPPIPYGRVNRGITFHWGTRRTGASRMIAGGADVKTVQKVGNWASAELVLDIYAEAIDKDARRAVEIPGQRQARQRKKGDR